MKTQCLRIALLSSWFATLALVGAQQNAPTVAVNFMHPSFQNTTGIDVGENTAAIDGVTYRIPGSLLMDAWGSSVAGISVQDDGGALVAPSGYELKSFRLVPASGLPSQGFLRVVVEPFAES
jgi:hypothetical protein